MRPPWPPPGVLSRIVGVLPALIAFSLMFSYILVRSFWWIVKSCWIHFYEEKFYDCISLPQDNESLDNRVNMQQINDPLIYFDGESSESDVDIHSEPIKQQLTVVLPQWRQAYLTALQHGETRRAYTSFDNDTDQCVVDNCANVHI